MASARSPLSGLRQWLSVLPTLQGLRVSEWQIALDLLTRDLALKGVSLDQRSYCLGLGLAYLGLSASRFSSYMFPCLSLARYLSSPLAMRGTALTACERGLQWRKALLLFEEMRRQARPTA